ncbi:hypothetical protein AWJ20_3136 [Sugiyamaella lignohabitans]|uniref:B box-type domain-containing protein n=1 Tax=Sugiyamaella lignohabitans TaxID=796027 RepID=A0A167FNC5_9ASCO|nr:uncharacterized protein AWJ20_3136 [Sugiyamaella lignohabitans]ANB15508.1 hypothetical protein AWJ20_3136 [Sugiyamaella lignohabitans]
MSIKRPLKELLAADEDAMMEDNEENGTNNTNGEGEEDWETVPSPVAEGLCVECGDQPAELSCTVCSEDFCSVCFGYLHRTGNRKSHKIVPFNKDSVKGSANGVGKVQATEINGKEETSEEKEEEEDDEESLSASIHEAKGNIASSRGDSDRPITSADLLLKIKEHSKYIPMRLNSEERKLLRLLEAALNVSEYTDKVDILLYSSKAKRMIAQLKEMCSILAGLVVATNMQAGQSLFEDKEFSENAEWFQDVFEIGRRYKIMNPEKMRDSFGKLMYMIMDSRLPEVKDSMEFDLYKPLKTVFGYLHHKGGLSMLDDELVLQATVEINPDNKSRANIQADIRRKEKAIEVLARKYSAGTSLTKEDIRQCLYSIGDYHAYLRANRYPVEQMIKMLTERFDANQIHKQFSLGISYGKDGARLSHNHERQYHYVHQSLTLWSQIMRDMFMLWTLADNDLLSENNRYRLADTGQGLNRIKPCPQVSRAMHNIIRRSQERTGQWIGSSVVHLGDHTVPNALFFLDKYLQVPRILTPVFIAVSNMDRIARDPYVHEWISSQFGSVEDLKTTILCDFFRHAFDGSGADNFYDAGSCIDGRLTSAWNWANTISKKPYYKKFLVSGFTGFNGTDGF